MGPAEPDVEVVRSSVSMETSQAIAKYLVGRQLDAVEGVWIHDENTFEIIIAKNHFGIEPDYDYVGIITRADRGTWKQDEVKVLLQKTSSDSEFSGVWLTQDKTRRDMTFDFQNKRMIQARFVSSDGDTFFVRIRKRNALIAAAR